MNKLNLSVDEDLIHKFLAYMDAYNCPAFVPGLAVSASIKREIKSYPGGGTHQAALSAAALTYDITTLSGMSGVGCTSYADPVKAEFGRSLDWTIPCNIGPYLKKVTYNTGYLPVDSHIVPGVVGWHTVESDWLCVGLNQAPVAEEISPARAAATVVFRHRILGRVPTLVWLRTWVMELGRAMAADGGISALRNSVQAMCMLPPIADALITGLLRLKDGAYIAFTLNLSHNSMGPACRPDMCLTTYSDTPVAQANHLIVPREDDPAFESLQREEAALQYGLKSFDRAPVYDKYACALKIKRKCH